MRVDSFRFGVIDVPDDKVIVMERPILGFEQYRSFCMIEINELRPFLWLQSTDNPLVAFLVVNPAIFFPTYRIEVNSKEIAELMVERSGDIETYVIVTIPANPEEISANLQGPILLNPATRQAKQLVLVNSAYEVRHLLLDRQKQTTNRVVAEEELVEV